jgi:hypothetical protein
MKGTAAGEGELGLLESVFGEIANFGVAVGSDGSEQRA